MKKPTLQQYRDAAKKRWHDEGVIEIDDKANISKTPDSDSEGAYVQAWVWVPDDEALEGR